MMLRSLTSQWGATGYVAVVSMALVFALGRILGPASFGEYSYVLTVASLLVILQDGGFRTMLFREGTAASPGLSGARVERLPALANGHLAVATFGIVCTIALWSFSVDLLSAVLCFALISLAQFASARLKATGQFPREAAWQVLVRTFSALAIVALLLVRSLPRPAMVFAAWGCGVALALVVSRSGRMALQKPVWFFSAEIYKACLAFAVIDFATTVYFRIDVVMLRSLTGDDALVGYYSAIYRLLEGVILLAAPVAVLCFRQLRLRWEEHDAFRDMLWKMAMGMLFAALTIVWAGKWLGPTVINMAYGPAYSPAHGYLPWLLATLLFALPSAVLTQASIALNRERYYAIVACGAAAVNVLLNWWLIPNYAIMGAIWATIATEAFLCLTLVGGLSSWLTARA